MTLNIFTFRTFAIIKFLLKTKFDKEKIFNRIKLIDKNSLNRPYIYVKFDNWIMLIYLTHIFVSYANKLLISILYNIDINSLFAYNIACSALAV
jgi:hypothetical protein